MKSYIGYSTDAKIRYKATSGGIGTSLIKWMFDKKIIGTSISFDFDAASLRYIPKMIHSFSDYKASGSIYQEIDLVNFIRRHIDEIKGAFACFTLPCQTRAVRTIVEKSGHDAFIIGLACSSQQTLDATKYLLRRIGIVETDVSNIQYRGNGWPSGIQITRMDGGQVFIANNRSIWTEIFHSRLFIRPKCLMCQDTLNKYSDITLADPWLKQFSNEKEGKTLVVCNTTKGEELLQQCAKDEVVAIDDITYGLVVKSQNGTILRKSSYHYTPNLTKYYKTILGNKIYRKIMLMPFFFPIHCKLKNLMERYLLYKQRQSK